MALVELLGIQFFECAYIVVLFFIPYLLTTNQILIYALAVGVMYGCYIIIQERHSEIIDIKGKIVFITGCDSGIGLETAKALSSAGLHVVAGCLSQDSEGYTCLKELRTPEGITVIQVDLTKEDDIEESILQLEKLCGEKGLHALVNNAGVNSVGAIEMCSIEYISNILNVNLLSHIRMTKACLPLIRKSKGRIVNMSSVRGVMNTKYSVAYNMSKHALESFSDTLRLEMHAFGVNVSVIEPGNFSGATDIISELQMKKSEQILDMMSSEASEEIKSCYPDHKESILTSMVETRKAGSRNLSPISTTIRHAVSSALPKTRYIIGGGTNQWLDFGTNMARLHPYLPDTLMDKLLLMHKTV